MRKLHGLSSINTVNFNTIFRIYVLPVVETTSLLIESEICLNLMPGVSDCLKFEHGKICVRASPSSSILLDHVTSLITRNAYGEAHAGLFTRSHKVLVIFENALIIYGIIGASPTLHGGSRFNRGTYGGHVPKSLRNQHRKPTRVVVDSTVVWWSCSKSLRNEHGKPHTGAVA